jgi:hypothetical protein
MTVLNLVTLVANYICDLVMVTALERFVVPDSLKLVTINPNIQLRDFRVAGDVEPARLYN